MDVDVEAQLAALKQIRVEKEKRDRGAKAAEAAAQAASGSSKFNPPSATLCVGSLAVEVTEALLGDKFVFHGNVFSIHLPEDDNDAHKGYAYVSTTLLKKQPRIWEAKNGIEPAGRKIRIDYAKAGKQTSKTPLK